MPLRGWIKRLEHSARGDLASFVLKDGSRYYFDPASGALFVHACACVRAGANRESFPEPPDTIKAIARARDRTSALDTACGSDLGMFPYERAPLVECGELVPASWIHPIVDMSE